MEELMLQPEVPTSFSIVIVPDSFSMFSEKYFTDQKEDNTQDQNKF